MPVPNDLITFINETDSFLAHAHIGPDPDSVGAILSFKLGLESIGKVVHLFSEDEPPSTVRFLPAFSTIDHIDLLNALTLPHDAYVSLDTAKWELASHYRPIPTITSPIINIDHHPDNNISAQFSWLDPGMSSASEMVYHLLIALKVPIIPQIATCLLSGILYDTDFFQNTNTTPSVHRLVADLEESGADYNRCLVEIGRSYQFSELRLWSILLKNFQIAPDNSFVWSTLSYSEWQTLTPGSKPGGFANAIISRVDGTDFGALLTEKNPGITKGSLRARRPGVDISKIAHHLNGGGHQASSGFLIEKPLKEAEKEFLSVVSRLKALGEI